MPKDPENIVLAYLWRIDEKVDRLAEDARDLKLRVTSLVESVVGLQRRMDRFASCLDRIEKRLDLADMAK